MRIDTHTPTSYISDGSVASAVAPVAGLSASSMASAAQPKPVAVMPAPAVKPAGVKPEALEPAAAISSADVMPASAAKPAAQNLAGRRCAASASRRGPVQTWCNGTHLDTSTRWPLVLQGASTD